MSWNSTIDMDPINPMSVSFPRMNLPIGGKRRRAWHIAQSLKKLDSKMKERKMGFKSRWNSIPVGSQSARMEVACSRVREPTMRSRIGRMIPPAAESWRTGLSERMSQRKRRIFMIGVIFNQRKCFHL